MQKKTLGMKIKETRLEKKLTQKELAGDFITRNMLSQIENDIAVPSIRTMEYIAKRLNKPVGYFIDEVTEENELNSVTNELLRLYENGEYNEVIDAIKNLLNTNPKIYVKEIITNIYLNCCMKAGMMYKNKNDFENAKNYFEKMLEFEDDLAISGDMILYKVYCNLAEVSSYMNLLEESIKYNKKAKNMINKMIASREVQSIYLKLVEGSNEEVIEMSKEIQAEKLDMYNRARYNTTIASAYNNMEKYEDAISYYEKALRYYKHQKQNRMTAIIYEEISRCYNQLEDYEKAYEYIKMAEKASIDSWENENHDKI